MKTENQKLGQEPAFATERELKWDNYGLLPEFENGMSKRFYAACAAMQGMLATGRYSENGIFNPVIGRLSFEIADELLKAEIE
jgi:hypothetical protein